MIIQTYLLSTSVDCQQQQLPTQTNNYLLRKVCGASFVIVEFKMPISPNLLLWSFRMKTLQYIDNRNHMILLIRA